ncbi:MAG: AAA family ATPase, partial [Planctomycetes bacterium]|nr:AAA family ATPase [Planctomycetota bacterium]
MYTIERHLGAVAARRAANSKAILLTGPRQVGKSTLFGYLFAQANRVSFDDDLALAQALEDPGLFLLNHPRPLLIDEVQKCPAIFNRLKMELDGSDAHGQFFLTGSQKLQLMAGVSETLAGRVSILELDGLSLREIHDVAFCRHFVPTPEYLAAREKRLQPYG